MAWYNVKCDECGKEFRVQLVGKVKDREWKLEHWTWTCDECKAKKREEEAKKAMEKSNEMELPELVGSEKQIKWALQIRLEAIKEIEKQIKAQKALERLNPEGNPEREEYLMRLGFDDILKNEKKASWWIDNRGMGWGALAIRRGKKVVNELSPDAKREQLIKRKEQLLKELEAIEEEIKKLS